MMLNKIILSQLMVIISFFGVCHGADANPIVAPPSTAIVLAEQAGSIAGAAAACGQDNAILNQRINELLAISAQNNVDKLYAASAYQRSLLNAQLEQANNPKIPCSTVLQDYAHLPILQANYQQTVLPMFTQSTTPTLASTSSAQMPNQVISQQALSNTSNLTNNQTLPTHSVMPNAPATGVVNQSAILPPGYNNPSVLPPAMLNNTEISPANNSNYPNNLLPSAANLNANISNAGPPNPTAINAALLPSASSTANAASPTPTHPEQSIAGSNNATSSSSPNTNIYVNPQENIQQYVTSPSP